MIIYEFDKKTESPLYPPTRVHCVYEYNQQHQKVNTTPHRWELPGNYPVFTVVMAIYH